jgi:hypothetical protein
LALALSMLSTLLADLEDVKFDTRASSSHASANLVVDVGVSLIKTDIKLDTLPRFWLLSRATIP